MSLILYLVVVRRSRPIPKAKPEYSSGSIPQRSSTLGVNHAGSENFNPAGTLADAAALSSAFRAGNVDLDAGLGEWEKGGAEFDLGVGTVYFLRELFKCAFKVAHCNALGRRQVPQFGGRRENEWRQHRPHGKLCRGRSCG